ncbi:sulfite exporter TauE/SafE family protein [Roseovarius tibetensis]|uniref:sulfite exporter TauE/SafE family protein n=1 Tax=Roseovarius tibetensis TaxID=2685897 RepID=UPI003D7F4FB5
MDMIFDVVSQWGWIFATGLAFFSGVVKGVVGFAMPMMLMAGLSTVMSPDLALAGLILPTLVANLWQALRQGPRAALASMRQYRVFLVTGGVVMLGSAQLVPVLPPALMFLIIGSFITLYALATLLGRGLHVAARGGRRGEAAMGALAGVFGGVSGIWGPPTVAMLTARATEKREQMRVQGVIFALGSVLLLVSHTGSGVLRAETLPLSLWLVGPAVLGVWLGFWLQDRFDQATFRKATLWVLLIAGTNLIRRGLMM